MTKKNALTLFYFFFRIKISNDSNSKTETKLVIYNWRHKHTISICTLATNSFGHFVIILELPFFFLSLSQLSPFKWHKWTASILIQWQHHNFTNSTRNSVNCFFFSLIQTLTAIIAFFDCMETHRKCIKRFTNFNRSPQINAKPRHYKRTQFYAKQLNCIWLWKRTVTTVQILHTKKNSILIKLTEKKPKTN